VRVLYLAGRSAELRGQHAEDVEVGMPKGEPREALCPALVRELDRCLTNFEAALAEHVGHGLDQPEGLLRVRVIDKENPGASLGIHDVENDLRSQSTDSWWPGELASANARRRPGPAHHPTGVNGTRCAAACSPSAGAR